MVDPEVIRASTFPTFIAILVLAMVLWALAFVRLTVGFRTIIDRESGIRISPVQIGWVIFAWAFLFVSFWPVIDVLLRDEWVFSDLLVMGVAGLLFFFAAAAIAPDGTYKGADGDARYLEVAPLFFGLFAAYQVWLVVMDAVFFGGADAVRIGLSIAAVAVSVVLALAKSMSAQKVLSVIAWFLAGLVVILQSRGVIEGALVRPEELAPLQGGVIAIWLGAIALAVLMAVALTMVQIINRHSGFRPYVIHTAWAAWFFFSMILVWWRAPLLATDGWDYIHLLVVSAGPLAVFLAWTFLAPSATEGSAEAAKAQYFDKAPQGFSVLAFVAGWAAVVNLWLVDGTTAVVAAAGWVVAVVLFIALTRSRDVRLHASVVILAWLLLLGEYAFEIERGVPTL